MAAAMMLGGAGQVMADDTYIVTSTSGDISDGYTVESVYGLTITYHGSWSYSTDRISSGNAKPSTNTNSSLSHNVPTGGDYIEIVPSVTGNIIIDAYFFKGNESRMVNAENGHIKWSYSSGSNGESVQNIGTLIAGNTYRLYKNSGSYSFHLKSITFTPADNKVTSYTIGYDEIIGAGNTVNDIAGITMTFGSDTEAVWTENTTYDGWGLEDNCPVTLTDGIPTAGTFVKVEPSVSGMLTVQWYHRNGGKGKLNLTDGSSTETISPSSGSGTKTATFSTILSTSKTYYLYISGYTGSIKIGFVGFTYKTAENITAVDDLGYTFSSTLPLDFTGTGVEAYTAAYNSTTQKVELTQVYKVPANTGLFIKGMADDIPVLTGDADVIGTNNLVAVSAETTVAATDGDNTNYVLALADKDDTSKGVLFLKAADTAVGAGKAYLQIPTDDAPEAPQLMLSFDDVIATGINTVHGAGLKVNGYYDLQGRKVMNPKKGLYIVNGKKVVIK